jgi:hypothetical protein
MSRVILLGLVSTAVAGGGSSQLQSNGNYGPKEAWLSSCSQASFFL